MFGQDFKQKAKAKAKDWTTKSVDYTYNKIRNIPNASLKLIGRPISIKNYNKFITDLNKTAPHLSFTEKFDDVIKNQDKILEEVRKNENFKKAGVTAEKVKDYISYAERLKEHGFDISKPFTREYLGYHVGTGIYQIGKRTVEYTTGGLYGMPKINYQQLTSQDLKKLPLISRKLSQWLGKKTVIDEGEKVIEYSLDKPWKRGIVKGSRILSSKLLPFAFAGLETYLAKKEKKIDTSHTLPYLFTKTAHSALSFAAFEIAAAAAPFTGGLSLAVGIAAGVAIDSVLDLAFTPIEKTLEYDSFAVSKYNQLRMYNFAMPIMDNQDMATMRQRSLQAIQRSHMSARQFVLGNEANLLAHSL